MQPAKGARYCIAAGSDALAATTISSLGVPSIFPKSGGIEEFFPDNYILSFNQFDYKDLENKLKFISNTSQLEKIGNENKSYIFNYLNEKKLIDSFNRIIDGK